MKGSVLIVDDDSLVRATLRLFLEGDRWEVIDARNGKQALDQLRARAFDAIVTDLMMPEMEGIETILKIRQSGIKAPILVISGGFSVRQAPDGSGVADLLRMSRELGATETLAKPFKAAEFLERINRLTGVAAS
ncbi:response regulator transcription factor [Futiania mangrovi]|uniref:Response regulator n=1 Tax=Futiania mangrovi TaxID=2959716 RepID=A0A9J6PCM4_9PROT|nr:response regulator [Futiania mangrovii]MCP1335552.1 response regulator [Futiania mangrovii]